MFSTLLRIRQDSIDSNKFSFSEDRTGPYRWSNVVGTKFVWQTSQASEQEEAACRVHLTIAMGTPKYMLEMVCR